MKKLQIYVYDEKTLFRRIYDLVCECGDNIASILVKINALNYYTIIVKNAQAKCDWVIQHIHSHR